MSKKKRTFAPIMDFLKKLPTPENLAELMPLSKELQAKKQKQDAEMQAVFAGDSHKLIVAVGPCSADRVQSVVDYVCRLGKLQKELTNLLIVPRIYTAKPRTIGNGYKGILHYPYMGEREDMYAGVLAMRNIHLRAIEASGLFPADEMLYPELIQYVADLLGYVVVGARSVENQQHRLVASGVSVPVGMKNPLSGNIDVMLNAIETAQNPHRFLFNGWEVASHGNAFTHAVLRGSVDENGNNVPMYKMDDLLQIEQQYRARNLANPAFIIDCNHSNSGKNYLRQVEIAQDVLDSMLQNAKIRMMVKGLMIESYIEDGNQSVSGGVYGQSITDPCLGWEKTEVLLRDINQRLTESEKS